jgi:hypothetical protein
MINGRLQLRFRLGGIHREKFSCWVNKKRLHQPNADEVVFMMKLNPVL